MSPKIAFNVKKYKFLKIFKNAPIWFKFGTHLAWAIPNIFQVRSKPPDPPRTCGAGARPPQVPLGGILKNAPIFIKFYTHLEWAIPNIFQVRSKPPDLPRTCGAGA